MKFNDNLRNLRIQRGLTQTKLAEALGTAQSSIAAWENCSREPDFRTIQRIATYFDVPLSSLLPSDDSIDADFTNIIAESMHQNPKLRLLFDRTKNFSESDLDAVLVIVNAISRERDSGD